MNLGLLIELTKRDFTERYSGSILGVWWSFIWPLISISIYIVIFSKIMSAKLPGATGTGSYAVYLISGLIPWTAFISTISRSSTVLIDKKTIISKIKISFIRLPLFIVLSESITFLITMSIFFIFLAVVRAPLQKTIILLPFIYIIQQIFAYSFGFIMAMFTVFVRDLKEAVNILTQLWFWFTPIVYTVNILPAYAQKALILNPAYIFVQAYHSMFITGEPISYVSLIALAVEAHVLLILAFVLFRSMEKDIRDTL